MEQPQYNLTCRERVEKEYHPLYSKHGLGLTTFSALKGGFLTGKYDGEAIPENTRLDSSSKDAYISTVVKKFHDKDPEIVRNIIISRALKVSLYSPPPSIACLIINIRTYKQTQTAHRRETRHNTRPTRPRLGNQEPERFQCHHRSLEGRTSL